MLLIIKKGVSLNRTGIRFPSTQYSTAMVDDTDPAFVFGSGILRVDTALATSRIINSSYDGGRTERNNTGCKRLLFGFVYA